MDDNQTPSTPPLASQPAVNRLVRRSPRPMALEQRFVFDSAGGADVVEAVSQTDSAVAPATAQEPSPASEAETVVPQAEASETEPNRIRTARKSIRPKR